MLIIGLLIWVSFESNDSFSFDYFDNQEGHSSPVAPNIVHYVIYERVSLDFTLFLSMTSVLKIHQPDYLFIHSDGDIEDNSYFRLIKELANLTSTKVLLKWVDRPTHVFGQPLSSVFHQSDVTRLAVLMKYGGIYLDTDMVILKPLDKFLHFEMVVAWPTSEYIGNQILIGHKEARFLKRWLFGYRIYKPRMWYYNAGQYPTEQILQESPQLAHRVTEKFGVHNLLEELYEMEDWDWSDFYAIHLLSRHPPAPQLDEVSILTYNKTFGEIARWILYGISPVLNGTSSPLQWDT